MCRVLAEEQQYVCTLSSEGKEGGRKGGGEGGRGLTSLMLEVMVGRLWWLQAAEVRRTSWERRSLT